MQFANKQVEYLPIVNLTEQQFLNVAIETTKLMGWVFGDINTTGFIAYTNNGLFSWNAEVRLKIKDGSAILQSGSRGDDVTDVRENKKNLQRFITTFNGLKKLLAYEKPLLTYDKLKSTFSSN